MSAEQELLLNTDIASEDRMKDQYLIFEINGEDYGIEIAYVKELIKMQALTKVPKMPDYIEGITNLRGDLIGVLDVRKRFGMPPKAYDESTCIVIIMYDAYLLGLIVDTVKETAIIPEEQIIPPPAAQLNRQNQFVRNIWNDEETVKLLLDLGKFLEDV